MFDKLVLGGGLSAGFIFLLVIVSIWTLIWKGMALWHAARSKQKGWFIVMLIINSMGLIPIIYLLWFKNEAPKPVVVKQVVRKPAKKVVKRAKKKVLKKKVSRKRKK